MSIDVERTGLWMDDGGDDDGGDDDGGEYGEVKIVDFGLAKASSQLEDSEPVGIAQRLRRLEVVVAARDEKVDRFAVAFPAAAKSRDWRWNSGLSREA